MLWVVYTRARARTRYALYTVKATATTYIPLYSYITHYTYGALGGHSRAHA